jgi:CheY-like chemotaxis protein
MILLVEDNPDDEALTLRALQRAPIANRVVVVRDGEEALEYLFRTGRYADGHDPLPDVIFLDLKLPKVSGLEVLKQLRENRATRLIPVAILTSSSEDRDVVDGYSLGANSFIVKPVDMEQFTAAVQQVALYWLLLNQVPGRV